MRAVYDVYVVELLFAVCTAWSWKYVACLTRCEKLARSQINHPLLHALPLCL